MCCREAALGAARSGAAPGFQAQPGPVGLLEGSFELILQNGGKHRVDGRKSPKSNAEIPDCLAWSASGSCVEVPPTRVQQMLKLRTFTPALQECLTFDTKLLTNSCVSAATAPGTVTTFFGGVASSEARGTGVPAFSQSG